MFLVWALPQVRDQLSDCSTIRLSAFPTVRLSNYPSDCPTIYLIVRLSNCPTVPATVRLSNYPSDCQTFRQSIRLSNCPTVRAKAAVEWRSRRSRLGEELPSSVFSDCPSRLPDCRNINIREVLKLKSFKAYCEDKQILTYDIILNTLTKCISLFD